MGARHDAEAATETPHWRPPDLPMGGHRISPPFRPSRPVLPGALSSRRVEEAGLKKGEEVMEIPEAFDLTGSLRAAARSPAAITRRWRTGCAPARRSPVGPNAVARRPRRLRCVACCGRHKAPSTGGKRLREPRNRRYGWRAPVIGGCGLFVSVVGRATSTFSRWQARTQTSRAHGPRHTPRRVAQEGRSHGQAQAHPRAARGRPGAARPRALRGASRMPPPARGKRYVVRDARVGAGLLAHAGEPARGYDSARSDIYAFT